MISIVSGPLIVQPEIWTLVFNREASTWWASWLAMGRYKHVRAYAYVPFLHVWVFYDVHLSGTDIIVAADGEPAQRQIAAWIVKADLIRMRRDNFFDHKRGGKNYRAPVFGFCVPAIKRLLGLRCVAVTPDALYRFCLKNGGAAFESPQIRAAAA